jgi:tellurite resistance protein TehA-like permease
MTTPAPRPDANPVANKHTAIGVCLNLLLLAMISYGYWQSEDYKWAWVLVFIPIAVVTLRYAWHLLTSRS